MIVFWRLFVAMFAADFLLFHKIGQIRRQNLTRATAIQTAFFVGIGFLLCRHYLTLDWPFLNVWNLPGWLCLLLMSVLYAGVHQFFNFGGQVKHGYLLTFLVKNAYLLLILFLCSPLKELYKTGHFFAQPVIIFLAGLIIVTHQLAWFTSALESDRDGFTPHTFDEQWLMTMVRTIFYLVMLLPGIRWLILLIIWLVSCLYARRIRLMDVSNITFYIGIFGSVWFGLLVRLRLYLLG